MTAREPLSAETLEQIDPGVRRLVTLLRAHGFDTMDSGDGAHVAEKEECCGEGMVNDFPHVFAVVPPERLAAECDRLRDLYASWGLDAEALNGSPDGPGLEGVYMPGPRIAHIALVGVTDADLPESAS